MRLTEQEARNVVWDDSEDWENVAGTEEIVDQRRWVTVRSVIYKHTPTQKYYQFFYERGSTENVGDIKPFEGDKFYEPLEVELKKVEVEKWIPVKK